MQPPTEARDEQYFQLLAQALQVCMHYKPRFGKTQAGLTLEQFRQLYGADPFYTWIGLDSPLMYAAHKAAGGMTSIYRQLGIGCQWIFGRILQDYLGLSTEQAAWSYQLPAFVGRGRSLYLDGRVELADVQDEAARNRMAAWLQEVADKLQLPAELRQQLKGSVFEVRQGYKSKDSKRQNADIANATHAYISFYIPVLLLLSTQIDQTVASRYRHSNWLLLYGTTSGQVTDSTYVFCRDVLGYDLAGFFQKNTARTKKLVEQVLAALLEA